MITSQVYYQLYYIDLERIIGIEPMSPDWKSGTLPIKLYSHSGRKEESNPEYCSYVLTSLVKATVDQNLFFLPVSFKSTLSGRS